MPSLTCMHPIIGITARTRMARTAGGELPADTVQHTYRTSVAAAGGIPLLLPPVDEQVVPAVVRRVDGVVLTGGGDIDPTVYGGIADDTVYQIDPERDRFELALATELARRRTPTLAICRGMQVINVALGGSLVVDIPQTYGTQHSFSGDRVAETLQRVDLTPGSRLADVIGGTSVMVNSIHHQAVDRLGEGLTIVGRSDDGVVEAVEATGDWPLLAVQWHPEYLTSGGDVAAKALFAELVRLASSTPS